MKLSLIISVSNRAPKPPVDSLAFGNCVELDCIDAFDLTLDALIADITNYRDTVKKVAAVSTRLVSRDKTDDD